MTLSSNEPEPVDSRFFRGFALAVALSALMWAGAGAGLVSAHPHFARAAYHKVKPVLHEARVLSQAALSGMAV